MNKTFNVNINGMMFVIDMDAYDLLSDYLDTLHQYFAKKDDGAEIVADIEARISEILYEKTQQCRLIVSLHDVEEVITQIGKPEDMVEVDIDETPEGVVEEKIEVENPEMETPEPPKTKRRLFRDLQNKLVGGVCSGLACYIGADPTFVRLAAVALMFLSFSTVFWIYIILWIIVPEARTPLQRMQMKGESPTLENIGKSVTDTFRSTSDYLRGTNKTDGKGGSIAGRLSLVIAWIMKIFVAFVGIICIPVLVICVLGLFTFVLAFGLYFTSAWPVMVQSMVEHDAIYGEFGSMFIPMILGCAFFCIVVGIPVFVLIKTIFTRSDKKPLSNTSRITLISTWSAAVVICFFSFLTFIIMGESKGIDFYDSETKEVMLPSHDSNDDDTLDSIYDESGQLEITVNDSTEHKSVKITGNGVVVNK